MEHVESASIQLQKVLPPSPATDAVTPARYAAAMTLRDTDPDVRRRQFDVYRAMDPARRVQLAVAMSEDVRRITIEGIRARNPTFDDTRVHHEWLRILHGDELAGRLATHCSAR